MSLEPLHTLVIPNRAEGPVRNLLPRHAANDIDVVVLAGTMELTGIRPAVIKCLAYNAASSRSRRTFIDGARGQRAQVERLAAAPGPQKDAPAAQDERNEGCL